MCGFSAKTGPTGAAGWGDRLRVVFVVTGDFPRVWYPGLGRFRPHHDTGCPSCRDGNADMTSDNTTNPGHVGAHTVAIRECSARLSLKQSSSARAALDGACPDRGVLQS